MTKSELKSIIMECLEEEGMITEAFDEDEALIESCEFIEESCFMALDELADEYTRNQMAKDAVMAFSEPKTALKDMKAAKKEIAKSIKVANKNSADPDFVKKSAASEVAKKLGKGFKNVGGQVVCTFKGDNGRAKQGIAIAAAATALAASIAAIAMKMHKKGENEEKKDEE